MRRLQHMDCTLLTCVAAHEPRDSLRIQEALTLYLGARSSKPLTRKMRQQAQERKNCESPHVPTSVPNA
ncbi:hypothetical protein SAMN06265795_1313 [Noviherbaspirillum humi]|uniref:Uncharacterized protein n=1 Tax=Noviherbaspirillum humi TaxID=1688639 RepID=A0A239M597_9BURK|nr:hypothetical protein SAMN06265795_1313 [Noviherbaspirillum humi]